MAYDLLAQREYDAEGRADRDLPASALPARRPEYEGCGDQYHRDDRERNAGLSPQFLFIAYRLLMPLSEVMDIPVERDRRYGFRGQDQKLNLFGRHERGPGECGQVFGFQFLGVDAFPHHVDKGPRSVRFDIGAFG